MKMTKNVVTRPSIKDAHEQKSGSLLKWPYQIASF